MRCCYIKHVLIYPPHQLGVNNPTDTEKPGFSISAFLTLKIGEHRRENFALNLADIQYVYWRGLKS